MTTKTKVVFFIIVGFVVFLIAGIFTVEALTGYTLPTRGGVEVDIEIAVAPSLEPWVREAATTFNAGNPQITVKVIPLSLTDIDRRLSPIGTQSGPDAWIAEAGFVRGMFTPLPYDEQGQSVAQTRLVWLAVSDRGSLANTLDWDVAHTAATDAAAWQSLSGGDTRFDAAIPSPRNSVEGLAVYISAVADFLDQADLTNAPVSSQEFIIWMDDILLAVPQSQIAPDEQLLRTPPPVDVGILLESHLSGLPIANFTQHSPQYNVILNYPYLIRRDPNLEDAEARQTAAQRFRDFLLAGAQQQQLAQLGFAPAGGTGLGTGVQIDGPTANTLWNRVK